MKADRQKIAGGDLFPPAMMQASAMRLATAATYTSKFCSESTWGLEVSPDCHLSERV